MKIKALIIVNFVCVLGFSQRLFPTIIDTNSSERSLTLDASAELATTGLNNGMLNRFLFGGAISNDVIQANHDKQKTLNRGGAILSGNLMYTDLKVNLFKNAKIGYGIQYGYSQVSSLTYTDHLYDLVFQGNKNYANVDMRLTGTTVRNMAFQKIGFGLFHKATKSSLFFNLVGVSSYFKGGISDGVLQQSIGLDTLTLAAKGSFSQPYRKTFMKGMGFSVDFNYNIPIRFFKNKRAILQVQVHDLGFAYFDGGVKRYSMDSTYRYTGFTVSQLFNGVMSKTTSLMDTLGITQKGTSKWEVLPFYIQISKAVNEDYEGEWQSLFGLRAYPTASYRPLIYAGVDYRPIKPLHIGALVSYGGFTSFKGTLYLQYKVKNFGIGVATDNIVGAFSKKGFGQAYNLQLSCTF